MAPHSKQANTGFTLIEILVTLAITASLLGSFFIFLGSPLQKAQDSRAKKDLNRLKIALEDYYTDNRCYPPAEWFDDAGDCSTDWLQNYGTQVKCDPKTNLPYLVEYDSTGCKWFRIYTNLYFPEENLYVYDGTGRSDFNYGVGSSNILVKINFDAGEAGGEDPDRNYFYCQDIGNCTAYDGEAWSCSPNYANADCNGECAFNIGSCVKLN